MFCRTALFGSSGVLSAACVVLAASTATADGRKPVFPPKPDPVMSAYAAQGARLNQQALMAATRGSYSTAVDALSAGATLDSTGGAKATWESATSRRPKNPVGQRLGWFRRPPSLPRAILGGRPGRSGGFSRRIAAVGPAAPGRAPVMERLFVPASDDNRQAPQFGNFKRALDPSQGGLSHIRIELQ